MWSDVADRTSGVRPRSEPSDEELSELIGGQYRLLGPIGESCYGRAVRAEHASSGREVALHIIPGGKVSERVLLSELPLITAKCALLAHPNVVPLESFGRVDGDAGAFYLVTDRLEGTSLADFLRAQGDLPLETALLLGRQIGRALRAAHKLGIVHGDLRPANVRVSIAETGLHARVMGFGRIPLPAWERSVGTASYAAPEVLAGEKPDARADVYSLGALLFRMVTGTPPYLGATPEALLEALAHQPVPSLREQAGELVSLELDALVAGCLAKSKQERFPDVVTVMTAMRVLTVVEEGLAPPLPAEASVAPENSGSINTILPSLPGPPLLADTTALASGTMDVGPAPVGHLRLVVALVLVGAVAFGATALSLLLR